MLTEEYTKIYTKEHIKTNQTNNIKAGTTIFMENLRLEATQDGSFTLFSNQFQEIYHSKYGAVQESKHVFIQEGLAKASKFFTKKINLLEVGWGTGLNLLLTYQYLIQNPDIHVHFTALEPIVVPIELIEKLPYCTQIGMKKDIFLNFHHLEWNKKYDILPNLSIEKINANLDDFYADFCNFNHNTNNDDKSNLYDLIYFDPFAYNKHPEMWEMDSLQKIAHIANEYCFFVTYSAKGQLKRDLQTLGFTVENPKGALNKREMTRAIKIRH